MLKNVFSFRVDSIFNWTEFISNWRFPDCVHFFGAWASQVNSPASCTKTQKELRRCCSVIVHNSTKHFLCPIRSQHSLDRLEMVLWVSVPGRKKPLASYALVGTQGLFPSCCKTFVEPFLPARLTAPGSPRMWYPIKTWNIWHAQFVLLFKYHSWWS